MSFIVYDLFVFEKHISKIRNAQNSVKNIMVEIKSTKNNKLILFKTYLIFQK